MDIAQVGIIDMNTKMVDYLASALEQSKAKKIKLKSSSFTTVKEKFLDFLLKDERDSSLKINTEETREENTVYEKNYEQEEKVIVAKPEILEKKYHFLQCNFNEIPVQTINSRAIKVGQIMGGNIKINYNKAIEETSKNLFKVSKTNNSDILKKATIKYGNIGDGEDGLTKEESVVIPPTVIETPIASRETPIIVPEREKIEETYKSRWSEDIKQNNSENKSIIGKDYNAIDAQGMLEESRKIKEKISAASEANKRAANEEAIVRERFAEIKKKYENYLSKLKEEEQKVKEETDDYANKIAEYNNAIDAMITEMEDPKAV